MKQGKMSTETSKIALNARVHVRTANQQMSRPERHVDDITDMRRSCRLRENNSGRRPFGSSSRLLRVPNTYLGRPKLLSSTVDSDGRTLYVPNLIRGDEECHPYCLKYGNKLINVKFTKPGNSCYDFSVICVLLWQEDNWGDRDRDIWIK